MLSVTSCILGVYKTCTKHIVTVCTRISAESTEDRFQDFKYLHDMIKVHTQCFLYKFVFITQTRICEYMSRLKLIDLFNLLID